MARASATDDLVPTSCMIGRRMGHASHKDGRRAHPAVTLDPAACPQPELRSAPSLTRSTLAAHTSIKTSCRDLRFIPRLSSRSRSHHHQLAQPYHVPQCRLRLPLSPLSLQRHRACLFFVKSRPGFEHAQPSRLLVPPRLHPPPLLMSRNPGHHPHRNHGKRRAVGMSSPFVRSP
jgi:hypothetical protein